MTQTAYRPLHEEVFDTIIFGGGYAGYAAAMRLRSRGKRVLLVERRAALLHESGWAFALDAGSSDSVEWQELTADLAARGRCTAGFIDGALAEIVAANRVIEQSLPVLFYMHPVAAWHDSHGRVGAVAVAGKGGVRVLRASQWIDATDAGELLAILTNDWQAPQPGRRITNLFYRSVNWGSAADETFTTDRLPGALLHWRQTPWTNERVLSLDLPAEIERPRLAWLAAMEALHARHADQLNGVIITHASAEPLPIYNATVSARPTGLADNVAVAGAGAAARTLANRFEMGLAAADALLALPRRPIDGVPPFDFGHDITPRRQRQMASDVVVAGAGTGGAFAALAAARAGAAVLAIEPLPFVGGIGSGGGIHMYYFGAKGGLQEEVDERTRQVMHLFGRTQQVAGFHPDAKKVVLEQMLTEAGVNLLTASTLFAVDTAGRRITAARVATPAGPATVRSDAWIDATGDGDLAAMAGAGFIFGRAHDGVLHAYSQSAGRTGLTDDRGLAHAGQPRMYVINYDAGFVDPTDPEDLTRARLVGVKYYLQQTYTDLARPTYIAPAIGLRQGRQIRTRYVVSLADLVERRTFEDVIGLTGCHYDNHAVDYEFESDEALFWVWGCRQWRAGRTACQMPYRMMLPEDLDNVWVACRAAGVSEEAHHSLRMQRDFQRLGEAAGVAAAIAADQKVPAPAVPYEPLRRALEQTGALAAQEESPEPFGAHAASHLFTDSQQATAGQIAAWADAVRRDFGMEMYKLMRSGTGDSANAAEAHAAVAALLADPDAAVSWRGAMIAAMWSDAAAEPRLLAAIRSREFGFAADDKSRPEQFNRMVPNWVVAVAMLRRCGTAACLEDLWTLAGDTGLLHNQRTTLALTCQHLVARLKLDEAQKGMLLRTLAKLLDTPAPNAVGDPQRKPVLIESTSRPAADQHQPVVEDFTWQLHLAVAKAEAAAGAPIHPQAQTFLADARALVRRAFHQVLQQY